jgi:hypothetical protein
VKNDVLATTALTDAVLLIYDIIKNIYYGDAMFSGKKIACTLAVCLTAVLFCSTSHAVYFTFQLKNGNEIVTDHYTEDSNAILHFYTNEGAVALPKSSVKSIKSNDGSVSLDMEDEQKKAINTNILDENAEDTAVAEPKDKDKDTDKDKINSINDQLFVINANLENLAKNKNLFISQQEQYQQQKQKSEERIATLKKSNEADMQGTKDAIELEQAKVKDLDSKLSDMDQRMKNNDQIFDAQQRIKQRFESDLAKLQKPKQ